MNQPGSNEDIPKQVNEDVQHSESNQVHLTEDNQKANQQNEHKSKESVDDQEQIPQQEEAQQIHQGDESTEQFHKERGVEKSSVKTLELKQEAAKYFVVSDFYKAIDHYEQAMEYCPIEDVKMLSILNSNLATCYAKQGQFDEVIHYATDALKLDPNFVKALHNRAASYEKTDKLEEALEDYKKMAEIDPADKFVRTKVAALQITVEQIQEKRKTEVLSGLKDLGNTILGKFGMSLDSFKLNQNENGSYNIQYKQ